MSVILAVCGNNYLSMMSDGRVVRFDNYNNDSNYVVVDENYKKIERVNKNVCVGIGGDAIASLTLLAELNNYQKEFLTLEKIKKIIYNKAIQCNFNRLGVKILIGGINRKNQFSLHTISSKDNFITDEVIPKTNEHAIKICLPDELIEDKYKFVDKNLYKTQPWHDYDELKQHMKNCIIDISKVNNTVNNNIFEEMITY